MARTDREVAQRYAAKKRKKRTGVSRAAPVAPAVTRTVERQDELVEAETAVVPPPAAAPRSFTPRQRTTPVVRIPTSSRRPFSSYAAEYSYVMGDLKRVALVSSGLLLVLFILSLFIH
jgi:hypothetical protein